MYNKVQQPMHCMFFYGNNDVSVDAAIKGKNDKDFATFKEHSSFDNTSNYNSLKTLDVRKAQK
jgi:hypothetical protein